jgi:hypothetical protein
MVSTSIFAAHVLDALRAVRALRARHRPANRRRCELNPDIKGGSVRGGLLDRKQNPVQMAANRCDTLGVVLTRRKIGVKRLLSGNG